MELIRGRNAPIYELTKRVTYTGAASLGATGTNATIFTVTGSILVVHLVSVVAVNLGESAATSSLSLGTTGSVARFIAATLALDLDAGDLWIDATPTETEAATLPAAMGGSLGQVLNGTIILTAHSGVGNTNAGAIDFTLRYIPINGGSVA